MEKTKLAPTDKDGKIVAETDKYHMIAYKGPPNTDTGPNNIWGIYTTALLDIKRVWTKDFITKTCTVAKPCLLKVVGHSRGAVASSLIAVDFYNEKDSIYKPFVDAKKIEIDLVQYDPVPGLDEVILKTKPAEAATYMAKTAVDISKWMFFMTTLVDIDNAANLAKSTIDYAKNLAVGHLKRYYEIEIPDIVNSTVVYSLDIEGIFQMAGNYAGFYPQKVINADKYILSNKGAHNAGANDWFIRSIPPARTENVYFMGAGLAQLHYGPWFMDYGDKPHSMEGHDTGFLNMICSSNTTEKDNG